jgi:hypothetical protein
MLGWINNLVRAFVIETFGEDAWRKVVAQAKVPQEHWVSTCPYSDTHTYG